MLFLVENDESNEFAKEVLHWKKADYNSDRFLDQHEFLGFHHPEHNKQAIELMADTLTQTYDHDQDGVRNSTHGCYPWLKHGHSDLDQIFYDDVG